MEVLQNYNKFTNKCVFSIVFFLVIVQAQLKENYEPVRLMCHDKCDCQKTNDSFLLNCTNRGMTHVPSEWPTHSKHLIASFSENNISELQQMPTSNAETIALSFSHCGIRSLPSAMFIDATGIEFLDLSWNLLTGLEIRSDVFRGRYSNKVFEPISLTHLDLSHNHIQSLSHSVFEHTPHLQQLNLNHNPLTVIDPQSNKALSSVLSLRTLHLANTSLAKLPTDLFARLRNLREIDLSENKMEKVPEALALLSASLEKLKIGGNLIQHLEDHDFMGLHTLRELNISGMSELETIRHNTFAYLPKLQILHAQNNRKLCHIHEHAFGIKEHIPNLQELYLTNCNLETLSPFLLHWSNLSVLELSGNRWFCDCTLFQTLSNILNTTSDILAPVATCSTPLEFAGTALDDIGGLHKACEKSLEEDRYSKGSGGFQVIIMKTILVLSVVMLTLLASFVFWKVLVKYNTIRSMNTMFPVMYVSAPTTEN